MLCCCSINCVSIATNTLSEQIRSKWPMHGVAKSTISKDAIVKCQTGFIVDSVFCIYRHYHGLTLNEMEKYNEWLRPKLKIGTSIRKLPPSVWPVGKSLRAFSWLMIDKDRPGGNATPGLMVPHRKGNQAGQARKQHFSMAPALVPARSLYTDFSQWECDLTVISGIKPLYLKSLWSQCSTTAIETWSHGWFAIFRVVLQPEHCSPCGLTYTPTFLPSPASVSTFYSLLLRFYGQWSHVTFVFLCLACVNWHNILQIHLSRLKGQNLIFLTEHYSSIE